MIGPGVFLLILGFTIFEHRLPRHLWHSGQVTSTTNFAWWEVIQFLKEEDIQVQICRRYGES